MIKVFFCCSWDHDSKHYIDKKILPLTDRQTGIWDNIEVTTTLEDAEWVVIMDDIPKTMLKQITHFNKNKVICFPREKANKNPLYLRCGFKYAYTYSNFYHVWSSLLIGKNYNELLECSTYPKKNKLCSTITSAYNPQSQFYPQRVQFIKDLSQAGKTKINIPFPLDVDIYGYGWSKKELGSMYKGVFEGHVHRSNLKNDVDTLIPNSSKWDGLINYKYSIAIENSITPNLFEEKFTDCILAWTIPIYCGCPNIANYFPKDCYYWLDITSPTCFEDLQKILQTPITKKNIEALRIARDLILHKYNVVAVVHNIINED